MAARIISDGDNAVLYCSSSMWAFGPVFDKGDDDEDPTDRALRFMQWLKENGGRFERHPAMIVGHRNDPREFTDGGLISAHSAWLSEKSPLGGILVEPQDANEAATNMAVASAGYKPEEFHSL